MIIPVHLCPVGPRRLSWPELLPIAHRVLPAGDDVRERIISLENPAGASDAAQS